MSGHRSMTNKTHKDTKILKFASMQLTEGYADGLWDVGIDFKNKENMFKVRAVNMHYKEEGSNKELTNNDIEAINKLPLIQKALTDALEEIEELYGENDDLKQQLTEAENELRELREAL